jgi:predicted dehydrogenase
MQPEILIIGSGGYGEFIQSALRDIPIEVTMIDGRETIDFKTIKATHIIIATPNFTHADFVADALKAGKHVLCEKPLALTLADVKRLYHLAHAYKRYLGVGFVLNNHPFYSFIKAGQSKHGPIRQMRVFNHATEGTLEPKWYWNKEQSGGWFMVAEIHWYHLFAWLTGADSMHVAEASEEKFKKRTKATQSKIVTPDKQELVIEHRIDMTYDTAWTKVEVVFDDVTLVIDDWVPRSCVFPPDDTQVLISPHFVQQGPILWDQRDRDQIYQDLVRENVIRMLKEHPADHSGPIILAHKVALEAQKLADK